MTNLKPVCIRLARLAAIVTLPYNSSKLSNWLGPGKLVKSLLLSKVAEGSKNFVVEGHKGALEVLL